MSSNSETQDEPVMAGATHATEEEKEAGRQEQLEADVQVGAVTEDYLRSIRGTGENMNGKDPDSIPDGSNTDGSESESGEDTVSGGGADE